MKRRELLLLHCDEKKKSYLFSYRREARVQHWMRLELQELCTHLSAPQSPVPGRTGDNRTHQVQKTWDN